MATPKATKFTEEELNNLKDIRKTFNDISFKLGQIEIQKESLREDKRKTIEELNGIIIKEKDIAKVLLDKYGKGTIDIDSGEFIPVS